MTFVRVFVNVIGPPLAGKSRVSQEFVRNGFGLFSPGQFIRDCARIEGVKFNSRSDSAAYRQAKIAHDKFWLSKAAAETPAQNVVIEGIRVVNEILKLESLGRVVVVAVECNSDEERFRRAQAAYEARGRRDKTTLGEFIADESAERFNEDPDKASIGSVMAMATYRIDTLKTSLAELPSEVDKIVADILGHDQPAA
jgi:hypothetical protein